MNIGFIGAGKVGFSLGKYLKEHGASISGYMSRSEESAFEASRFTDSGFFGSYAEIVGESDVIFVSVPDGQIENICQDLKKEEMSGKIICHLSGAKTSAVFDALREDGAYGYSVHPFLAISDRYESWKSFSEAVFTVEGDEARMEDITGILRSIGNRVTVIDASKKVLYHTAASIASNFMVTLLDVSEEMLKRVGFSKDDLSIALTPLVMLNIKSALEKGPEASLTGPIERGDVDTVLAHLGAVNDEEKELYKVLALRTIRLAQKKHHDRDYLRIEEALK